MDRERTLIVVRQLTREVVRALRPEKLAAFEADFAAFALSAGMLSVAEGPALHTPLGQGLETTLVAGMFFAVLRDASRLPAGADARVAFVRKEAKNYLVNRLAGQITLSQFYRLLNLIEEHVQLYFAGLKSDWLSRGAAPPGASTTPPGPGAAAVDQEGLRQALARLPLPQRGRKLTSQGLWLFLCQTAGNWFRVLDLEEHFQVNKKTAWSCLNLLLKEALLEHNGAKANQVRYALAPAFRREPDQPAAPGGASGE